ncbi:hypothetical protein J6590_003061 [Homalodisca vitripennis]|nr:hypothetical protein J6590_003061 [Homalodisca vitripennis]
MELSSESGVRSGESRNHLYNSERSGACSSVHITWPSTTTHATEEWGVQLGAHHLPAYHNIRYREVGRAARCTSPVRLPQHTLQRSGACSSVHITCPPTTTYATEKWGVQLGAHHLSAYHNTRYREVGRAARCTSPGRLPQHTLQRSGACSSVHITWPPTTTPLQRSGACSSVHITWAYEHTLQRSGACSSVHITWPPTTTHATEKLGVQLGAHHLAAYRRVCGDRSWRLANGLGYWLHVNTRQLDIYYRSAGTAIRFTGGSGFCRCRHYN